MSLKCLGASLFAIAALSFTGSAPAGDKDATYLKLEARGKLQTGVVAIGGETTGVLLKTKDGTLELQLDKGTRETADNLSGKDVIVTGNLTIRKGVEVRQRIILNVKTLKAAD